MDPGSESKALAALRPHRLPLRASGRRHWMTRSERQLRWSIGFHRSAPTASPARDRKAATQSAFEVGHLLSLDLRSNHLHSMSKKRRCKTKRQRVDPCLASLDRAKTLPLTRLVCQNETRETPSKQSEVP
jgi:hypothetical protein